MKNKTCCFTGHRNISINEYPRLKKLLEAEIIKFVHQGVQYFGAGGALGFDTLAALSVLKLKEEYPQIKLILVLPCKEQTSRWKEKDIKTYNQIIENADKVVYTSENYHRSCMFARNRYLVDNSSVCICYLIKKFGGTEYTVGYARKKGLKVINLAQL